MQGGGALIAVVGPSGAGKDTLITYARQALAGDPAILFVRRVVTRAALAAAEDHDTLSPEAFAAARSAGAFAVEWQAHGLSYGIPMETRHHLAAGGVAVVNGSRAALPAIRSAFREATVIHVTCRPEILAERLAARRRESETEMQRRLERAAIQPEHPGEVIEIDNSGELAVAGEALVGVIRMKARVTGFAVAT
jgi:ribose 1,5-bisphosphokinase